MSEVVTTDPNPAPIQTVTQPIVEATPARNTKTVMIPDVALKQRLDQAKKSGRTAYQQELDTQAQTKGFANHAAMMAHVDSILTRTPQAKTQQTQAPIRTQASTSSSQPPLPPKNRNDRQAMATYERDKAKWQREKEQSESRLRDEQKRRRRAERERDAIQARSSLDRIASRCGVKDTDYAIILYERHCQGKTEEELGKMDEESFFKGLRQTHSYIFGETVVPATTGTAGAVPGAHVLPTPTGTAAAAGQAGSVDVRKMNKQQYQEFKRTQPWSRATASSGRAS
jgi:hypothetical protein